MLRVRQYGRRRRRLGLGYPVLPDQFNTKSGQNFSFSPQTPDSAVLSVLTQFGQQLPADLQAKWDAAQQGGSTATPPSPSAAVTPAGTPVSTQTGAGLRLTNIAAVVPGVFQCTMSDGSQHYCDVDGNPISYTPPAPAPAVTPAASQPMATVAPAVQTSAQPGTAPAPLAVAPSGVPVSSTTGTPAAVAPTTDFMSSIMNWLKGSMVGGIPNWGLLLAGGALLLFSEEGKRKR